MDVLPSSPSDRYCLTNCYACKTKAKPEQEFIRNYGGVVCFSCRAFFRRAFQKSVFPTFVCKRGGSCAVTVTNERKCQKCRMDRCLLAGMSNEAILTEEQKKKRFRKMIQKRAQEATASQSGAIRTSHPPQPIEQEPSSDNPVPGPSRVLTGLKRTHQESVSSTIQSVRTRFETLLQPHSSKFLFVENRYRQNSDRCTTVLDNKVRRIVHAYKSTVDSMSCTLLNKVKALYLKSCPASKIYRKDIISFILQLSNEFKNFANQIRSFQRLHPEDQSALLARNTPIFVQLQMITSLLVPFNKSNILGSQTEDFFRGRTKKSWMKNYHQNLFLEKFNEMTKLFKPDCDLDTYGRLINTIKPFCQFNSVEEKSVLAYLILFDRDDSTPLRSREDIEDLSVDQELLFNHLLGSKLGPGHTFEYLSKNLVKMALFCSYYLNWSEVELMTSQSHTSPQTANIVMPYTAEEEVWLGQQIKQVDEAYRSVTIGEDFLEEFLKNSLGQPVSKAYFPRYLSAVLERLWRVLLIHPEFQDLPVDLRLKMMQSNCYKGMALNTVRGENSSGAQQLQNGFGELDETKWMENYSKFLPDTKKLVKSSILNAPFLTEDQKKDYAQLISNARVLNSDPVLFRLFILLTLTRPIDDVINSKFAMLHLKYSKILQRRLDWMQSGASRSKLHIQHPSHDEIHSSIMSSIYSLGKISEYLLKVFRRAKVKIPTYYIEY